MPFPTWCGFLTGLFVVGLLSLSAFLLSLLLAFAIVVVFLRRVLHMGNERGREHARRRTVWQSVAMTNNTSVQRARYFVLECSKVLEASRRAQ